MKPGDLNKRITIQKPITTTNERGFEIETWEDFKTVWAAVSNLHGREYYAAAAIQAENTVKFTICKRQLLFHKYRQLIFHKKRQLKFHTYRNHFIFCKFHFVCGFMENSA
jgi:SPP1 family predicted phage head-tail adaptor